MSSYVDYEALQPYRPTQRSLHSACSFRRLFLSFVSIPRFGNIQPNLTWQPSGTATRIRRKYTVFNGDLTPSAVRVSNACLGNRIAVWRHPYGERQGLVWGLA